MPTEILTRAFVTATELKEAPMKALAKGRGRPVAVVKHNTPLFYVVPADLFAKIHRIVEDHVDAREADKTVDEPSVDGPRNMEELDAWDTQIKKDRKAGRPVTDWPAFAAAKGLRPALEKRVVDPTPMPTARVGFKKAGLKKAGPARAEQAKAIAKAREKVKDRSVKTTRKGVVREA